MLRAFVLSVLMLFLFAGDGLARTKHSTGKSYKSHSSYKTGASSSKRYAKPSHKKGVKKYSKTKRHASAKKYRASRSRPSAPRVVLPPRDTYSHDQPAPGTKAHTYEDFGGLRPPAAAPAPPAAVPAQQ